MNDEVEVACRKLIAAVDLTMNPMTPQADRIEAFKLCEDFKSSPLCVLCGLRLCCLEFSGIIRHFGLQLLEHAIKFCWNSMSPEEKLFLKVRKSLCCFFISRYVHTNHTPVRPVLGQKFGVAEHRNQRLRC
jgi:hypothetical protein